MEPEVMESNSNGQLAEEYHPQRTPSPSEPPRTTVVKQLPYGINRTLLPVKGFYFVFMAAVGSLLPFIPVYMPQLGLTVPETGIIYGIMPFVGFFVRPLIGAIADKYKKHKMMLISVTLLSGLFYFLLVFVPSRASPKNKNLIMETKFECNTQDSFIQDCHKVNNTDSQCTVGIYHLIKENTSNNYNGSLAKPISCKFACQSSPDAVSPDFQVCLTNSSGPFSSSCNGTLIREQHLTFVVPDMDKLLSREIPKDRYTIGSMECRDYDLKEILYDKDFNHRAMQALCERELSLDCTVTCGDKEKECESDEKSSDERSFDVTFFAFFALFLLANIAFAPIFPIVDAVAYDLLGERRHIWGKQRVWGTLGFALLAISSSFIMHVLKDKEGGGVDYRVCFYIFAFLSVGSAFIAYFIDMSTDIKCGQFLKNVCKLLSYSQVLAFLGVVMYFGIVIGGLEAFLFRYLTELGSDPIVFGFMLMVNCAAEVPVLWIAGYIIKRIGLVSCLYLALVCYGLRLLVYSVIEEPWLVLLVEPAHGVTFGLMYAAASSYASIIAPPGMSSTVQGLLGGVHFGFGKGIGSFITGFIYKIIGPRWTWRAYSILSVVVLVTYVTLNKFIFSDDKDKVPQVQAMENNIDKEEKHDLTKQEQSLVNSDSQTVMAL
ncbi:major facilitator superfamily domain-containing protein 6-like [Plakobranchus ocellatus]|uniref:Major facilitator superfamily domain-containing protein 6-like n=1 Tax=Plakobranchus ocellatus TaxID=259542 RepID=A0AAV4CHS4_9GAST|nr:major facilitator superfamily domain-containing protein 6-like [Plakobranchus ocellatus]